MVAPKVIIDGSMASPRKVFPCPRGERGRTEER